MANPFDKVLEEKKLNYEDLTEAEKRLYNQAGHSARPITPEELSENIDECVYSVALTLCDTGDNPELYDANRKLKARLKNYLILQAFLSAPLKAAKAYERSIQDN